MKKTKSRRLTHLAVDTVIASAEVSAKNLIHKRDEMNDAVAELMKKDDIRKGVIDYIFGKSDENPLADIREEYYAYAERREQDHQKRIEEIMSA